jgi:uncharacterized phage protein (predicted DNA packaging)
VKKALRVSHDQLDEEEITPLIEAAKRELEIAGVRHGFDADPLVTRAIIAYCKAHFGYDNPDSEKFLKAFESIKNTITMVGEFCGEME